jgi:hypothetical protein
MGDNGFPGGWNGYMLLSVWTFDPALDIEQIRADLSWFCAPEDDPETMITITDDVLTFNGVVDQFTLHDHDCVEVGPEGGPVVVSKRTASARYNMGNVVPAP